MKPSIERMKNLSKRGENIYKRKDGRWEGRYAKGRKLNGKLKYGSVYGVTYQEVKQKLYPLKAKYQSLITMNGQGGEKLSHWANYWLTAQKNNVKPSTYASYAYKMKHYILPQLGEVSLNELDKSMIHSIIKSWQVKGLLGSTIRVLFQVLNNCLTFAEREERLFINPCKKVQLPRFHTDKVESLTRRQQNALEKEMKKSPVIQSVPALLSLHTGMRIGEIAALKWDNIDFDSNLIHIKYTYQRVGIYDQAIQKTQLLLGDPKTRASNRVIPMTRIVRKTLIRLRKQAKSSFVFSVNGHPCEPRLLTYYFRKLTERAKLVQIHFHQLRHTFATRCVEKNRDIASVSELLGHSSTQMTLDIYTSALLEQKMKVIHSIEA